MAGLQESDVLSVRGASGEGASALSEGAEPAEADAAAKAQQLGVR